MGVTFWVYGRGMWRQLDVSSGRVSGWAGRVRFCFVRRGRLQVAGASAVLRGLRALQASPDRPTSVREGTRLSHRRRLKKKRRVSPRRCCCHQPCHSGPRSHQPCHSGPRSHPEPSHSALVQLNVSTQCSNSTQTAATDTHKAVQPVRTDAAVQADVDSLVRAEQHNIYEEQRERHAATSPVEEERVGRLATPSESSEVSQPAFKELIVDEDDVLALRKMLVRDNVFRVDLPRFDADHDYKSRVFYQINPLVALERSAHIAHMLTQRSSLRSFARSLGLRAVDDPAPRTHAYRTRTHKQQHAHYHAAQQGRHNMADSGTDSDSDIVIHSQTKLTENKRPTDEARTRSNRKNGQKVDARSKYLLGQRKKDTKFDKNDNERHVQGIKQRSIDRARDHVARSRYKDAVKGSDRLRSKENASPTKSDEKDRESKAVPRLGDGGLIPLNRLTDKDSRSKRTENSIETDSSNSDIETDSNESDKFNVWSNRNGAKYTVRRSDRVRGNDVPSPTKSVDNKKRTERDRDSSKESHLSNVWVNRKGREKITRSEKRKSDRLQKDNSSPTKSVDSKSKDGKKHESSLKDKRSQDSSEDSDRSNVRADGNDRANIRRLDTETRRNDRMRSKNNSPTKGVDSKSKDGKKQEASSKDKVNLNGDSSEDSERSNVRADRNDRAKVRRLDTDRPAGKNNSPTKSVDSKSKNRNKHESSSKDKGTLNKDNSKASDRSNVRADRSGRAKGKRLDTETLRNDRMRSENNSPTKSVDSKSKDEEKLEASSKDEGNLNEDSSADPLRREYSNLEDHAIVAWVSQGNRAREVNGNRLWRDLQSQFARIAGRARTWHSLRNRYLRYILPSLAQLALPPGRVCALRAGQAAGPIKSKRRPPAPHPLLVQPPVRSAWAARPRDARSASPPPAPRTLRPRPDTPAHTQAHTTNAHTNKRTRLNDSPTYSELTKRFATRQSVSTPTPTPTPAAAAGSVSPPAKRTRLFNPKAQL